MQQDISHFVSLFENATEGFIVTDPEGKIMLVNPSACRMFGYEDQELVGHRIEVLIPTPYREGHVQLRQGFYEHPTNRVMGRGRDLHGQRKDGSTFPVEVSLSTYLKEGKRYVIAFLVDITLRKQMEEHILKVSAELETKVEERTAILKEALERLERSQKELSAALDKERQLNEIKSRFVSMASHEFRTPLSTVLSSASLIGKYESSDDQQKRQRHIDKIKNAVKHLNDLLDDFLSLGKLDEGKVTVNFAPLLLDELIEETIEDMQGLLKPGQQLRFDNNTSVELATDKNVLKNILINLISNAIKFSESDINIQLTVNGATVSVSVNDHGIGISEEDQQHLFSSFFRAANAQNIQGTGLGLHIVKRYLELLRGSIHLESSLGSGTTVTVTLPKN